MNKAGFIVRWLENDGSYGDYVGSIDRIDGTFRAARNVTTALMFDSPQQVIAAVQRRNASLIGINLGRFIVEKVVLNYEINMEALIDCNEGVIAFSVPMVLESEEQITPMTIEDLIEILVQIEAEGDDDDDDYDDDDDDDEALFGDVQ